MPGGLRPVSRRAWLGWGAAVTLLVATGCGEDDDNEDENEPDENEPDD